MNQIDDQRKSLIFKLYVVVGIFLILPTIAVACGIWFSSQFRVFICGLISLPAGIRCTEITFMICAGIVLGIFTIMPQAPPMRPIYLHIVNWQLVSCFLFGSLLLWGHNGASDKILFSKVIHASFYFILTMIMFQDIQLTMYGVQKDRLNLFVLSICFHLIYLGVLFYNYRGVAEYGCFYFVAAHLAYYLIEFYLQYAKPKLTRRNSVIEQWKTFALLFLKFFCLTLSLKINHLGKYNFAAFVFRDFVLLAAFYGKIWSYAVSLPPTISELFINIHDGIVYMALYVVGNVSFICYSFVKDLLSASSDCVPKTILMEAVYHVMFDVLIDLAFVLLIFFFDTNSRQEKIMGKNSKNILHMLILFVFIGVKSYVYYDARTLHWIPQIIPALYFQVMNYVINNKCNKELSAVRNQPDFETCKHQYYDGMIYENLNCISYEIVFLLTFVAIIQVR